MRLLLLACGAFFATSVAAFSPTLSSPSITDAGADGVCSRGAGSLECKWDGGCTQIGNQCFNCTKGSEYSAELQRCYSCGEGASLFIENGRGECKY